MPRPSPRHRAFTLMEVLVLLGIFVVLLSIFVPFVMSKREDARRARCAANLEQLRNALQAYVGMHGTFPRVVHDPDHPDGYAAFTGAFDPDPFAAGSSVSANDVTASLWLLVRTNLITDLRVFVCPSSTDYRDMLIDASGRPVDPSQRSNFRSSRNLSYSYASPFTSAAHYRFNNDNAPWGFVLLADKSPGVLAAPDAPPRELARGNSANHGHAGQYVLHLPGTVEFRVTPYSGVGYEPGKVVGDNIYSAREPRPTTQPSSMPIAVMGFIGRNVSPAGNDDSYLVPTALDNEAFALPTTRPTEPTTSTTIPTTATTTTAPTTQP